MPPASRIEPRQEAAASYRRKEPDLSESGLIAATLRVAWAGASAKPVEDVKKKPPEAPSTGREGAWQSLDSHASHRVPAVLRAQLGALALPVEVWVLVLGLGLPVLFGLALRLRTRRVHLALGAHVGLVLLTRRLLAMR